MDEYKLFVKRIGLVGITNILVAISSLILIPIMTKSFSTSDYGIWVQINTTIMLIPNIATLGLPYAMLRFVSTEKDKEKIREAFYSITSIVLIFTIIISLFLLLFSNSIASALFNGNVNISNLMSLIVLFACLNSLFLNFFRTFQQMKRYSVFLLIQTYLGLIIMSYFAINGFNIYMVALGLLIVYFITCIIMILFIISNIGFKIPKFKNIVEYLSFGIPTIPGNLSYWVVDSSDRYVIGIVLGTVFVGYYSPGYALGNMIIMILAPFSLLLPSILPKYYENGEIEKIKMFLKYSLKYFLCIAIPSAFGLSILSKPILMVLSTPEIALNGYMITPFIAMSALLFGIYGITSNILVLKKKTKFIGIVWMIAAFLNLSLNILFVPYFGILGAAAITLIAYTLAFILSLIYSNKFFKFDFDPFFILKSVTASVLMTTIIIWINPYGILNVLITAIIGSVVYFVLLTILKGIKKKNSNSLIKC
ncbi:MAG: oligosaccharide flippase family protein [Methanobacterium sp. ERen5]|nr:MAG: oligosaccharide flippase family protein [Methanobacterium sp. ERen5]